MMRNIAICIYIFFTVMVWSFNDTFDQYHVEPLNKPKPIRNFIQGILWPIYLPITIGRMAGIFSRKYL